MIYFSFLLLLLLTACGGSLFDRMKPLENANWKINESVKFDIDIQDTINRYDFYITLRHNTDYAYCNLYIFVNSTIPGEEMKRDTIEFILADEEGNWIGNGNGQLRTNEFLISRQYVFPKAGLYTFEFEQAMRDSVLLGITDIGINIEKSTQN